MKEKHPVSDLRARRRCEADSRTRSAAGLRRAVTGEIELRDLKPEVFESWASQREAFAEVTLPSPTAA
jgi:hypothetical protein